MEEEPRELEELGAKFHLGSNSNTDATQETERLFTHSQWKKSLGMRDS